MEKPTQCLDDIALNKAFEVILSNNVLSDFSREIAKIICSNSLSSNSINEVVKCHNLKSIVDVKEEMLDLILAYINIILNDNKLTQSELSNVKVLKSLFKIRERDFYRYRHADVKQILYKQLVRIYRDDNKIDDSEALFKVELQELFDLGYDQFLEFANNEDLLALERGANIHNLDTFIPPTKFEQIVNELIRNEIPKEEKDLVLARDKGECVICHSDHDIDFDYIVPILKGGSNTSRNIQILCKQCRITKPDEQLG